MRLNVLASALVLSVGGSLAASAQPSEADKDIQLQWPLACEPGRTCFIQNYVDRDPGPGVKDYRCGAETYDRHDGIDIRLPSRAEERRGVAVLAAAPGVVMNVRDGVPDVLLGAPGAPSVKGRECGNGVLIEHSGGWRTQYCHMQRGSIVARPGQVVKAGARLGNVGLSGNTEFPHLHITISREGQAVDPFAPERSAACGGSARSLWAPQLQARLGYATAVVVNVGFAQAPVSPSAADEGVAAPTRNTNLLAYAHAINLLKGDTQRIRLMGPRGELLGENVTPALERAKARWVTFAGKKAPAAGWPAGTYRATYDVTRGGRIVAQRSWSITL